MIQANVHSTQTMVNQRATEIRFKELTLFADNLGVIASLAAFFAETSLDSLYIEPETVSKADPENKFSTLCWALSAVTISLNLMTLLVAIYTLLHGPALAIRGPAGSMPLAVSRIFVQRKLALRLFWAGLLAKVVQAVALAAWRYPPEAAAAVSVVFLCFIAATAQCIDRVTKKFSFSQFGLRREDFIEIAVPGGGGGDASYYAATSPLLAATGGSAWRGAAQDPAGLFTGPYASSSAANGGGQHVASSSQGMMMGSTGPPFLASAPRARALSPGRLPVTHVGAAPEHVCIAGWLMKQSAYLKRWNSRHFVLTHEGRLSWSTSTAAPPRGSLDLRDADVDVAQLDVTAPGIPAFGVAVSVRDANVVHELVVATDSVEERTAWTRAILHAAASPVVDGSYAGRAGAPAGQPAYAAAAASSSSSSKEQGGENPFLTGSLSPPPPRS